MTVIAVDDFLPTVVLQAGVGNHRAFQVATQIVDGVSGIVGGFDQIDMPEALILQVEILIPAFVGLAGGLQGGREVVVAILLSQKTDDVVTPSAFQRPFAQREVFPLPIIGDASQGNGQMNVRMPTQRPAMGMQCGENAGGQAILTTSGQTDIRRQFAQRTEHPAISLKQRPKLAGDAEGNMLPTGLWQYAKLEIDPLCGSLIAAAGTGTAFTAECNVFDVGTVWAATAISASAHVRCATGQHCDDVVDFDWTKVGLMPLVKLPPQVVALEDMMGFAGLHARVDEWNPR